MRNSKITLLNCIDDPRKIDNCLIGLKMLTLLAIFIPVVTFWKQTSFSLGEGLLSGYPRW